ncbi:MAG: chorion class high-cysteine HCB protein 13 [Clostridia bacterium]|nr:chorion class high-cysteine HCB protein 13 [Clostridia bacterium]
MFNGLFDEHNGDCGCGGTPRGGCNCTWIVLILLFCCCCGGKMKNFTVTINPCCLILLGALLFCTGGVKVGDGK